MCLREALPAEDPVNQLQLKPEVGQCLRWREWGVSVIPFLIVPEAFCCT